MFLSWGCHKKIGQLEARLILPLGASGFTKFVNWDVSKLAAHSGFVIWVMVTGRIVCQQKVKGLVSGWMLIDIEFPMAFLLCVCLM